MDERALIERVQPHIYHDKNDPFPIRYMGCTVFTHRRRSDSFPKWEIDPKAEGARTIVEYAVYYDYDIQHMYDLEHVWVAVDERGDVKDCWGSFHGRRLRMAGVPWFHMEGTHPVVFSQPGKHAMMPDPALFELIPDFRGDCTLRAGGGLLIPDFLRGAMHTSGELDEKIARHIRQKFAFVPSMEFAHAPVRPEQLVTWPELLERIPVLTGEQIALLDA